ncbi:hypothetical protein ACGFJC_54230 [Nonomuraea fuscirosea]|uniref:hypothetical protein n=1 Tax=Nonomuraea fuscirosea TaxID=1291556 RepID=UPI00371ED2CA
MQYLLIRQQFKNYETWRNAFDSLSERRSAGGMRTLLITRNADNPNEAVVLIECANAAEVAKHYASEALKDAHERGGVIEGSTQITVLLPAQ